MYMYVCMDLYFRLWAWFQIVSEDHTIRVKPTKQSIKKTKNKPINQQTKQATSKPANQLTILQLISTPTVVAPKLNFKSWNYAESQIEVQQIFSILSIPRSHYNKNTNKQTKNKTLR